MKLTMNKIDRILYFYYIPFIEQSRGVYKKLLSQIKSSQNTKIDFLILTCDNIEIDYPNVIVKYLSKNKFKRLKQISYYLNIYSKKYKYILFRKFVFNPFLLFSFLKVKRNNTFLITEHHTKEIPEYISKKEFKKVILEGFGILFLKIFNIIYKIIGVTNEIVKYESNLYKKKGIVVGNGILFDEKLYTGFSKFDNKTLKLVMSVGDYYPWHGVERLIKSIQSYKGRYDISLSILAGNRHFKYKEFEKYKFIKIYYNLNEQKMKEIYKKSNLAVSSLSIYKNNLKEATPLKSREYLQRGIPFIYAYDDPDLNEEVNKYLFKVPNKDSIIDFEDIIELIKYFDDNVSEFLVNYAQNNLSWSYKLKKIEKFIYV